MSTETLEIVLSTAIPAITLLLAWAAKLLTEIIKVKVSEIKTKTDNELVKTYVDLISDNALNVVSCLEQTLVKELKAANDDGKLTAEDATKVKDEAVKMLTDTLSDDVKEVIGKVFQDTESYLSNVIEKTVIKIKNK